MVYILVGRDIRSSDGDLHHITSEQLRRLYGLDRKECVMLKKEDDLAFVQDMQDSVILGPRMKGDYRQHLQNIRTRC